MKTTWAAVRVATSTAAASLSNLFPSSSSTPAGLEGVLGGRVGMVDGQLRVLAAVEVAGPGRGGGVVAVLANTHAHAQGGRGGGRWRPLRRGGGRRARRKTTVA